MSSAVERETGTPLPPVGRHTEALEKPVRGRTREVRPRSETRVGRNSREPQSRPEVTDKRSPEVAAPDSKKIKLEQGIRPDVDMPDFGVHKLPSIDPGASACMTAQPSEETKPAENTASTEAVAATAPKSLLATRPPPPASFDLTADDDDDAAEDVEENQETQRDGDDDELKTAAPHTLTTYNATPLAPGLHQTRNPAG